MNVGVEPPVSLHFDMQATYIPTQLQIHHLNNLDQKNTK